MMEDYILTSRAVLEVGLMIQELILQGGFSPNAFIITTTKNQN